MKKIGIKILVLALMFTLVTFVVSSCKKVIKETYYVSFESNGGTLVENLAVVEGTLILIPTNPTKTGYGFGGWYTEETLKNNFTGGKMPSHDLTLYARWLPWSITVNTYSNNRNGQSSSYTILHTDSNQYLRPNTFESDGAIFLGWGLSATDTAVRYANNEDISSLIIGINIELNLYALWSKEISTISFESNGGSYVESITLPFESIVSAPSDPVKTGYTFIGWYISPSLNGESYIFSQMPLGNITLYAKYEVNNFNLYFDYNNSNNISTFLLPYNSTIPYPTNVIRANYTFIGWYFDNETFENECTLTTVPSYDITLYAYWVINQVTINFYSGYEGDEPYSQVIKYTDISHALLPNAFNSLGRYFIGWSLDNENLSFNNMAIASALIAPNFPVVNLYALWDLQNYTMSFDLRGGEGILPFIYNLDYSSLLPIPYKDAYVFAYYVVQGSVGNWTKDEIITDTTLISARYGNVTLEAYYTEDTFVLAINENGGLEIPDYSYSINGGNTIPSISRNGYNFVAYTVIFASGSWSEGEIYNIGDSLDGKWGFVILEASWEIITYTITYTISYPPYTVTATYNIEDTFNLNTYSRYAYTFGGWEVTSEGGSWSEGEIYSPLITVAAMWGDVTFSAVWNLVTYTLEYEIIKGVESEFLTYDSTYVFHLPSYTRIGYTFKGWKCTAAYGDGNWGVGDYLMSANSTLTYMWGNVTLSAVWEIINYTIVYDTLSVHSIDTLTYNIETVSYLSIPYKEGYTFLYWVVTVLNDSSFENEEHLDTDFVLSSSYGNITLEAVYSTDTYTITYYLDNENIYSTLSYTVTDTIYLEEILKTGYAFLGFVALEDSGSWIKDNLYEYDTNLTSCYGDASLIPAYSIITYEITFSSNGGDTVETQEYTIISTSTLPLTSRVGYTFVGWVYNGVTKGEWNNGTTYNEELLFNHYESITLEASYEIIEYFIEIIDAEDGFIIYFDIFTITDNVVIPLFNYTGYNLINYTVIFANGSWTFGEELTPTSVVNNPYGDVIIEAIYEVKTYTLTFHSEGGEDVTSAVYTYKDVLPFVSKAGYAFKGWSASSVTGNGTFILGDLGNNSSYDLYANYEIETYNLTVYGNYGDSYYFTQSVVYGETIDAIAPSLNIGYLLLGYSINIGSTEGSFICADLGNSGNYTLYAIWEIIVYDITYVLYGGTIETPNYPTTFTVLDTITLPVVSKVGDTFLYWDVSGVGEATTITAGTASNVTVSAVFTYKTFTITFNAPTYFIDGITQEFIYGYSLPNIEKAGSILLGYVVNIGDTPSLSVEDYGVSGSSVTLQPVFGDNSYNLHYFVDLTEVYFDFKDVLYYGQALPVPTKVGYTFIGWNLSVDALEYPFFNVPDLGEEGNVVYLSAFFELIYYDITYTNLYNTTSYNSVSYTIESIVTFSAPSAREGYIFSGWEYNTNPILGIELGSTGNITISATWEARYYSIVFESNGGSNVASGVYYSLSDLPSYVTKTGYIFLGWCLNSNFSDTPFVITPSLEIVNGSTVTIYAKYLIKTFNFEYESGNYTVSEVKESGVYNEELPLAELTGYDFVGWCISSDLSDTPSRVILDYGNNDSTYTLYPKFVIKSITITYNTNGGVLNGFTNITLNYGETIGTLNTASKTGYRFVNWYYIASGENIVIDDTYVVDTTNSFTIYALWQVNYYFVTYAAYKPSNASGNIVGDDDTYVYNYDSTYISTPNPFTFSGYEFIGWSTTPNGAVKYLNYGQIRNLTSVFEGDVILYTVWRALTYTVTLYNGNSVISTKQVVFDTAYGSLEAPSINGYYVEGWYNNQDYLSNHKVSGLSIFNNVSNVSLWVKYENETFRVKYNTNGGNSISSSVIRYGDTFESILYTPMRAYHTFLYWVFDENDERVYNETVAEDYGSNNALIILRAIYSSNYSITYNPNNPYSNSSVVGETINSYHQYGVSSHLSTNGYSLVGYTFIGWGTSSKGGVRYENEEEVINLTDAPGFEITLYAIWQALTYNIIFDSNGEKVIGNPSTIGPMSVSYDSNYKIDPAVYYVHVTYYTFSGWYTLSEGGELVSTNTIHRWESTEDVTYYAHYKPFEIEIDFQNYDMSWVGYGVRFSGALPGKITYKYDGTASLPGGSGYYIGSNSEGSFSGIMIGWNETGGYTAFSNYPGSNYYPVDRDPSYVQHLIRMTSASENPRTTYILKSIWRCNVITKNMKDLNNEVYVLQNNYDIKKTIENINKKKDII
ncbi:MAG: InlB B-repeat-containing protein [Acholeplasmatales bacterium]|jgi:uncharacterized repeat protein (TIGR02543 family)|nr:InlB B-repeat-containing protein [Acholeplasmatales bacterium]